MPKRGYSQISGARTLKRGISRKRGRRMQGLVPSYRGWQPRRFQLGELKYIDTALNTAMDTTCTQTLLNGASLGNTATTRVGMKIAIKSIELRLLSYGTAGTGTDQVHRLQLFMDRQANAAPPTLGDQLTSNNYMAFRTLVQRKRFKILWDKTYVVNATAEPGTARFHKMYMRFRRPLIIEYNAANNGTVADIVSNSLYLYAAGSNNPGATAGSYIGSCRIRFSDS